MATPTELDRAILPTLIWQLNITKRREACLLHHIRVHTRPIVGPFYEQHEETLYKIFKHVQTLGPLHAYHPLGIDSLAEAAVKQYGWKTKHTFKPETSDLCNTLSKELKGPFVNSLKVLHWIAKE